MAALIIQSHSVWIRFYDNSLMFFLTSLVYVYLGLKVGNKAADSEMDKEKSRRTEELTEKEYERRVAIAHKMLDVQKELLATHKPLKVHSRCMHT